MQLKSSSFDRLDKWREMSAEVLLLARKIVCDLFLDVIAWRLMFQRLAAEVTDESGDCSASSTMGLNRYNACRRVCVYVVAADNIQPFLPQ